MIELAGKPLGQSEAVSLAIFALNTLQDPSASSQHDLDVLDARCEETLHLLTQLRDQLTLAENTAHAANDVLYEKCRDCHLFVFPNAVEGDPEDVAKYVHGHRGDDVDEALNETHEAMPSGRKANLLAWKTYGPLAMRERFVS
jgi:hypothetical protein